MHLSWIWTYIHRYIRRTLLRAIIHEDAFRPEENGRTGSRPLGLSDLSRIANRGRDYDAIHLSPCCRAAYAVGNTELPAKTSLFGQISAACSESHFRNGTLVRKLARGSRSSGNLAMSYFCGNTFVARRCSIRRKDLFGWNKFRHNAITIVSKLHHFFMRSWLAFVTRLYESILLLNN